MDNIIVISSGLALIVLIGWFFFGKKEETLLVAGDKINILVDGGYKPSIIRIKKGQKVKFILTRRDPNSCLEEFILPDFKINKFLPLDKSVGFDLTPDKAGEYAFHCGMNMYHGKVIVG